MNLFWRVIAVLGLVLLTAQLTVSLIILNRIPVTPAPSPTFGQWRQKMTPEERRAFLDKLPVSEAFTYIDGQPLDVKIKDQPVEVRPVK